MKGTSRILAISAGLAALFAAFTTFIGSILILSFGWILGLAGITGVEILMGLFVVVFALFFLMLAAMGLLWSVIPRNIQLLLIAVVAILGILAVAPELEFVAVAGVVFTVLGITPKRLK